MNCFTLQFINILMVIQVLLEHKGGKRPEKIQECSFSEIEINVCVTPGNSAGPLKSVQFPLNPVEFVAYCTI